jgi:hypothetical protein
MTSPTQRSLKLLRERGLRAEVTERWNQWAKVRQDLFGIIDIVAIGDKQTFGVQTTSYSNMSARVKKIQDSDAYPLLKEAGWNIIVHGWKKNKSNRWEVKETIL